MNSSGYELNCVCLGNGCAAHCGAGTRPARRRVSAKLHPVANIYEPKRRKGWIPCGPNGIAAGALVCHGWALYPDISRTRRGEGGLSCRLWPDTAAAGVPVHATSDMGLLGPAELRAVCALLARRAERQRTFRGAGSRGSTRLFRQHHHRAGQGIAMGWWGNGQKNWMPITCRLVR